MRISRIHTTIFPMCNDSCCLSDLKPTHQWSMMCQWRRRCSHGKLQSVSATPSCCVTGEMSQVVYKLRRFKKKWTFIPHKTYVLRPYILSSWKIQFLRHILNVRDKRFIHMIVITLSSIAWLIHVGIFKASQKTDDACFNYILWRHKNENSVD